MTPTQISGFSSTRTVAKAPYSSITAQYAEPTTAELKTQMEEGKPEAKKGFGKKIFGQKKEMYDAIMRKIGIVE